MGFFSDVVGAFTGSSSRKAGKEAAKASKEAAQISADYMREALGYLKEKEALPQRYKEMAIQYLGADIMGTGFARTKIGLRGERVAVEPGADAITQAERIALAEESPLYGAIMSTQEAGEEAILRGAGATGMLRSGNVQEALAESTQELKSRALLESYNEQLRQEQYETQQEQYEKQMELAGLQTIMGVPSLTPQIAQTTSGIGETLAMGETAAAQAKMTGAAAGSQQMMQTAQMGLLADGMFSDIRLKDDIEFIGTEDGRNKYRWKWNEEAAQYGLHGNGEGFMAHELIDGELIASDKHLQVGV